jgi:hypothetical protein
MFSFFKKKEAPVEVQPEPVVEVKVRKARGPYKPRTPKQPKPAQEALPLCKTDMFWMSNDERRIAVQYGLSFEQFVNMRADLRKARKWGRPVGAKTKKRRGRKAKKAVGA